MITEFVEGYSIDTVVKPAMVCGRGRPQGCTKFSLQKSTQRDPLAYEYVNTDGAGSLTAAVRKQKSGECNEEGHNI